MSVLSLADHIRKAAWTHGNALRKPEVALEVARAYKPDPEVAGVTIGDGPDIRHDEAWIIEERGRLRELRLRVARGVIKDVSKHPPEPRKGVEL